MDFWEENVFKLFPTKLGNFSEIKLEIAKKRNSGAICGSEGIFGFEASLR